ncbi:MAG TPA: hypothetical protein VFX97_17030 [Pyrinomonadaceae bacterium]|nr:hypothetical protein [Pyrinomonadaceae bacterium]
MAKRAKTRPEVFKSIRVDGLRLTLGDVFRGTGLAKQTISGCESQQYDPSESVLTKLFTFYGLELKRRQRKLQELEIDLMAAGAVNGGRSVR